MNESSNFVPEYAVNLAKKLAAGITLYVVGGQVSKRVAKYKAHKAELAKINKSAE